LKNPRSPGKKGSSLDAAAKEVKWKKGRGSLQRVKAAKGHSAAT